MKKLFALFQQSLFIRLMAIFIVSVSLFIFIMSASLTLIYKKQTEELDGFGFFEHYINFVIDDFGVPPDIAKAKSLTDSLPIAIIIKDQNGNILLNDKDIELAEIKLRR